MIQSCLNTIYRTFVQSKYCIVVVRRPLLQNFIMINLNGHYHIHKHEKYLYDQQKTKTNPQYLVQCLRFDGFYYNSQLSTICAMLKQSAKPRSYASITWSSRDFYVTPNRAGSTCSLNKQWPRGKVKHCPISKNLISSFTARCDLPAESWARKNLKKGRTLIRPREINVVV